MSSLVMNGCWMEREEGRGEGKEKEIENAMEKTSSENKKSWTKVCPIKGMTRWMEEGWLKVVVEGRGMKSLNGGLIASFRMDGI